MAIGGSGILLPYPTPLYPVSAGAVQSFDGTNEFVLPAGGMLTVPAGIWAIQPGLYSWVQLLDPVTGLWRPCSAGGSRSYHVVNSDGANYRVYNPLGTCVGAYVTAVGSGYTSQPSITPGAGNSTWEAIIGGAISQTVTIGNDSKGNAGGTNFTLAPTLLVQAPPAGGIPATMYCTVSAGAINAVTVVDQGAGYVTAPVITVVPNPLDPTFGSITIPALTVALTGSGEIAAIINTYPGLPESSIPSLTISGGGGSSATAVAIGALTVTSVTVSGGAANTPISTVGGVSTTAVAAIINPAISTGLYLPRPANAYETGSSAGVVVDGGMFQAAPASGTSTATLSLGYTDDRIFMQQIPGVA